MARYVILVNGIPGSGKTTLADQLARDLGAPYLSKDRVKEGSPTPSATLPFRTRSVSWRWKPSGDSPRVYLIMSSSIHGGSGPGILIMREVA